MPRGGPGPCRRGQPHVGLDDIRLHAEALVVHAHDIGVRSGNSEASRPPGRSPSRRSSAVGGRRRARSRDGVPAGERAWPAAPRHPERRRPVEHLGSAASPQRELSRNQVSKKTLGRRRRRQNGNAGLGRSQHGRRRQGFTDRTSRGVPQDADAGSRLYSGPLGGGDAGTTPSFSHRTSALPGSAISSTEPYQ